MDDWVKFMHQLPTGLGPEWLVYFDQVEEQGLPFHPKVLSLYVKTRRKTHIGYGFRLLIAKPERGVWRYVKSLDMTKVYWGKKAHPAALAKARGMGIPFDPTAKVSQVAWAPFRDPCPISPG